MKTYSSTLLCMVLINYLIGYAFAAENGKYAKAGKLKQQSFSFIYGKGIKSVDFASKYSEDGAGYPLYSNDIVIESYTGSIKITVTAGKNGSNGAAIDFNKNVGYTSINPDNSHMLQLIPYDQAAAHKGSVASNHNLWLYGELRINGHLVSSDFVIGHNGSSDHNWWIGSIDGRRYDSPTNSGINVKSADSNDTYCINGYQNNYQAVVTSGACNAYSPLPGAIGSNKLGFRYGDSISSVTFEPTKYADRTYSEDGTGAPLEPSSYADMADSKKYKTLITITAGANGSCGTANDFNNKFGSNVDEQMVHIFQLMSRKASNSHIPAVAVNQNFWISGRLTIENTVVSNNFVIGHDGSSDHNWWIGSLDGRRYDSPTNSGMNVQGADGRQFCLNQYKNNYQLVVTNGACASAPVEPQKRGHWKIIGGAIAGGIVIAGGAIWGGMKVAGRKTEKVAEKAEDGLQDVVEEFEAGTIIVIDDAGNYGTIATDIAEFFKV